MQDEVSEKVIALCINGGKISARILKETLEKALADMQGKRISLPIGKIQKRWRRRQDRREYIQERRKHIRERRKFIRKLCRRQV